MELRSGKLLPAPKGDSHRALSESSASLSEQDSHGNICFVSHDEYGQKKLIPIILILNELLKSLSSWELPRKTKLKALQAFKKHPLKK